MEYVESIIADVHRLGIEFKPPITYTSDYFPEMLDLAERLIKAGSMYADDTPVEQMREVRTCALHTHAGHCRHDRCSTLAPSTSCFHEGAAPASSGLLATLELQ